MQRNASSSFSRLIAERFVEPRQQPKMRSQRLVAALRCVTASCVAIAVTAMEPGRIEHRYFALAGVAAYLAYALLVLAAQWWASAQVRRRVAAPLIDLVVISALMYASGGALSPLFPSLLFVVFSATYLTSVRGMTAVAALTMAMFVAIAFARGVTARDRPLFIVRIGFLTAASVAVIVRRAHETRVREELARFAAWPRTVGRDAGTMLSELSRALAELVRAPRVVIVWEEQEEPWLHVVTRDNDAVDVRREAPQSATVLLPAHFERIRFIWRSTPRADAFRRLGMEGMERWSGIRWPDGFLERFAPRSVVSVPLSGEIVRGRVYFLDGKSATMDTLHVAEVAVRLITADLEQQHLIDRLYDSAAARERMRVARDLHDGLLQSLTGISLQLASLEHAESDDARRQIRKLRELVDADHAQLRSFVTGSRASTEPLDRRLEQIAAGVEQRWSIAVRLDVQRARKSIEQSLSDEICSLATEALSNAARHARATQIFAAFIIDDEAVSIEIRDDGHGFPFRGRFDLDALTRHQRGPRMLRERVVALHGDMVVDSSSSGARVEIRVPLQRAV